MDRICDLINNSIWKYSNIFIFLWRNKCSSYSINFTYSIIITTSCTQCSLGIGMKSLTHRSTPMTEWLECTCGCRRHYIKLYLSVLFSVKKMQPSSVRRQGVDFDDFALTLRFLITLNEDSLEFKVRNCRTDWNKSYCCCLLYCCSLGSLLQFRLI